MNRFDDLADAVHKLEAAARRQDWATVERDSPVLEKTVASLSSELDMGSLNEAEQLTFKSVREAHARLLILVKTRQDQVTADMAKLTQAKKAQQAYGKGKL